MPSTSSAKPLESQVVVLAEEEVPDPAPTMEMTATANPIPTMTPSPTTPSMATPQTRTEQPYQSLLPVFQAIAMVLSGRLMALLLLLSAIAFGYLTISDPVPLRLVAGAGYAVFCLTALWVLPKK